MNVIGPNIEYYLELDDVKNDYNDPAWKTAAHAQQWPMSMPMPMVEVPRDVMEDVFCASKVASRVVGDALSLETMKKQGNLSLRVSPFTAEDIVGKCARLFGTKARDKGIRLTVAHEREALASSAGGHGGEEKPPLTLLGDSERIGQVLNNFVSNSLKFTNAGGEINVRYGVKRGHLHFAVEDSGIGISKHDQHTLFRPFHQLRAGQLQADGSGLGLAICKKILLSHGGELGVTSEEGKGSTFWFNIKAVELEVQKGGSGALLKPLRVVGEGRKREKEKKSLAPLKNNEVSGVDAVLVVEDSLVVAKILVRMALNLGVNRVEHAFNGIEALARFRNNASSGNKGYDFILMDHEMPDMNGSDATRELRKLGFEGKIVGITGNAGKQQKLDFLSTGLDAIMMKPINRNALKEVFAGGGGDNWGGNF